MKLVAVPNRGPICPSKPASTLEICNFKQSTVLSVDCGSQRGNTIGSQRVKNILFSTINDSTINNSTLTGKNFSTINNSTLTGKIFYTINNST
jgi:hypothetical protein